MKSIKTTKDAIKLLPLLAVSLFLLLASFGTSLAVGGNVSGFAWGAFDSNNSGDFTAGVDGGLGWLSFSHSIDFPTSPYDFYQVSINSSTGEFSGEAWSENFGYISFDAGCPPPNPLSPSGTVCEPRIVNFQTGEVVGWARACAVFQNGCSGALKPINGTELGGWDGWIKLSGFNHESPVLDGSRGVTFDIVSGEFSGFAWGGDVGDGKNGVGWISFGTGVTITGGNPQNCPADLSECPLPEINLDATPTAIDFGDTVTLDWYGTDLFGGCTIGTVYYDISNQPIGTPLTTWSGMTPTSYYDVGPQNPDVVPTSDPFFPTGTVKVVYTITCTGYSSNHTDSASATVFINQIPIGAPTVSLHVIPSTVSNVADQVMVYWTALNVSACSIHTYTPANSNNGTNGWSGSVPPTIEGVSSSIGGIIPGISSGDIKYDIQCTGLDGSTPSASDIVTYQDPPITLVLTPNPSSLVSPTQTAAGSVHIDWVATNATSCPTVVPAWTSSTATSGGVNTPEPLVLPAGVVTTFQMTCINNLTQQSITRSVSFSPGGPGGPPPPPIFEEF